MSDGNRLFHAVYDPNCDRFFLKDESTQAQKPHQHSNSRTPSRISRTPGSSGIPWEQWILPPKSSTLVGEENQTSLEQEKLPAVETQTLPQLDLSSIAQSTNNQHHSSSLKCNTKIAAATTPTPKKARVRNFVDHFARANARLPVFPDDPSAGDAREIKWNGEPMRVNVVCNPQVGAGDNSDDATNRHAGSETRREGDLVLQNVFELTQLLRIRPHPDGFRNDVNSGCTFTPLTSSSSSSSSEEVEEEQSSSSFSEDDLPVFHRGDRVLFRAKRCRLKGRIARHIKKSNFYDVKAANGTVFLAISAMRIRLLPDEEEQQEEEEPRHDFERGDRVLWLPAHTRQTYRARIVRQRSLHRFDIQLRTGRIVKKLPYEELRPRSYDN